MMKQLKMGLMSLLCLVFALSLTIPASTVDAAPGIIITTKTLDKKVNSTTKRTSYVNAYKQHYSHVIICASGLKSATTFQVWEYDPSTYDPKKGGNDDYVTSFTLKNNQCGVVNHRGFADGNNKAAELYVVAKTSSKPKIKFYRSYK